VQETKKKEIEKTQGSLRLLRDVSGHSMEDFLTQRVGTLIMFHLSL